VQALERTRVADEHKKTERRGNSEKVGKRSEGEKWGGKGRESGRKSNKNIEVLTSNAEYGCRYAKEKGRTAGET